MSDPRVFFAAERTLLSWIRTGLTVIALGFVVSRFSLFLTFLAGEQSSSARHPGISALSTVLGTLLVVLGSVAIFVATIQHRSFVKTLPPDDLPAHYYRSAVGILAYAIASLGFLLAIYLGL